MKTSKLWNEAIELLKQLNPSASQKELEKVADFGFGLAAAPEHFIKAIEKELKTRYVINVTYSLQGNAYTEVPRLECIYMAYHTMQQAIDAVTDEIKATYDNKDYHGYELKLPKESSKNSCYGCFKCAYKFGPMVQYDIRINKIQL